MNGVIVEQDDSFSELLKPLIQEVSDLYWLVDFQATPFDSEWVFEKDENEQLLIENISEHFLLKNTSSQLWRPGSIVRLAPHIHADEWSYLVGLKTDETNIDNLIKKFIGCKEFLTRQYFELVDLYAQIYIVYVDQWWEIYSNNKRWLDKLLEIPNARIISSDKWSA